MRGVLIPYTMCVPVERDLAAPDDQERERALDLAAAHAGSVLFADTRLLRSGAAIARRRSTSGS